MQGIVAIQASVLGLFETATLSPPETLFAARTFLECAQSQDVPGSWTEARVAKFSDDSGRLGRAIASLNDGLPAERDMARVASTLEAACIAVQAIAHLLKTGLRLHPSDAASFCHAAGLFMSAGTGFLGAWLDIRGEPGPRAQQSRALAAHSAVMQASAVRCLVGIAGAPGISGTAMPVLLYFMKRQNEFNQWLACVSSLVLMLPAAMELSFAGSRRECLADLAHVCCWALMRPSALQQRLHEDLECQTEALRLLLLQALPAAANHMLPPLDAARARPQPPPPPQQPTAERLAFLADTLSAIASPYLEPGRFAHYRHHSSRGLLRWAQRILDWLPLEGLQIPEPPVRVLYTDVCIAVLALLSEMSWWAEQAGARQADQQATYTAALQLLPKATSALRHLAANQLPGADPARLPSLFAGLANVSLMADLAVRQDCASAPEHCTAACTAAAAGLRLLPLLAELEQARASGGPAAQEGVHLEGADVDVAQGVYCRVAFGTLSLWHVVVWRASTTLAAGSLTPDSRAALRLLHTTTCRLVAWRATPAGAALMATFDPQLQQDVTPLRLLGSLQALYCDVLLPDRAVASVADDDDEEEEGGRSDGAEGEAEPNARWLRGRHGVSSAHWEAVQTLLPLLPPTTLAGNPHTAGSLVIMCTQMLAPPAPIPCGELVSLLSTALRMLPEGASHGGHPPPSDLNDYMGMVIRQELATSFTRYSAAVTVAHALVLMNPQQLATVVSSGLLAQVLRAVAAAAGRRPDAAFYGVRFVMHIALEVLKKVLAAARVATTAMDGSNDIGGGSNNVTSSKGTGSSSGAGGAAEGSSSGASGTSEGSSTGGSGGILQSELAQLDALLLELSGRPPPCPADQQHDSRAWAAPSVTWLQRLLLEALPLASAAAHLVAAQAQAPEQLLAARLERARAAGTRSCAHLRCANLALEGGPAAREGVGCKRCAGCRALWYCSDACQRADWAGGGHRRVCKVLAAARQEGRQARGAARAAGA